VADIELVRKAKDAFTCRRSGVDQTLDSADDRALRLGGRGVYTNGGDCYALLAMFGRPMRKADRWSGLSFSGCAEPAGKRFSQRERSSVGGFVDGCGPRDVGVRADREGVGWSVIGFGGVDVDALLPVPGGLAEVWAGVTAPLLSKAELKAVASRVADEVVS
jgi:hypothetical protein